MSYDIDEEFKKIIEKADRIVTHEVIQQDRVNTLSRLREEDGRLKIKINQMKKGYQELAQKIQDAKSILSTYERYFEIIDKYSGEEQQEVLTQEIDDYTWSKYSKIQDDLYALTKDIPIPDLEAELHEMGRKLAEFEERRGSLLENSLLILADIDKDLEEYEP